MYTSRHLPIYRCLEVRYCTFGRFRERSSSLSASSSSRSLSSCCSITSHPFPSPPTLSTIASAASTSAASASLNLFDSADPTCQISIVRKVPLRDSAQRGYALLFPVAPPRQSLWSLHGANSSFPNPVCGSAGQICLTSLHSTVMTSNLGPLHGKKSKVTDCQLPAAPVPTGAWLSQCRKRKCGSGRSNDKTRVARGGLGTSSRSTMEKRQTLGTLYRVITPPKSIE